MSDMNARTPPNLTGEPITVGMFDFTRWKPITPEKYANFMGEISFTLPDGQHIATQVEDMPDGNLRLVTWANVQYLKERERVENEPYLVLIHDSELKKATLLMYRTDVQLYKDNLDIGY